MKHFERDKNGVVRCKFCKSRAIRLQETIDRAGGYACSGKKCTIEERLPRRLKLRRLMDEP